MTNATPTTGRTGSFFRNIWNKVKSHPYIYGTIAAGGIAGGLLIYGVSKARENIIYDRVMSDGSKVVYMEGEDDAYMKVSRGGMSAEYFDKEGATKIGWMDETMPVLSNDRLERILIKEGDKNYNYTINDVNDRSIEGKRAKNLLEKGNKDYNETREKIRTEKRADFEKESANLEKFFN